MESTVQDVVAKVTDFIKQQMGYQHTADVLRYWFSLTDEQKAALFNQALK